MFHPNSRRDALQTLRSPPGSRNRCSSFELQSNKNYAVAQTASSQNLRPGSVLYFAGYPSPGPVNTKRSYTFYDARMTGRTQDPNEGYELSYTGSALPGMSGGPLLDSNARLVGIHGKADIRSQVAVANYGVPFEVFLARRGTINRDSQSHSAQRADPQ
ncbi:MAG: trypsin-like peptidase domain-containing protein [Microcoleus sp. SM1_3_4]|nr:trypsin-like peptidase domain-containing protein [Microcoleus sp. SM1_3_4]